MVAWSVHSAVDVSGLVKPHGVSELSQAVAHPCHTSAALMQGQGLTLLETLTLFRGFDFVPSSHLIWSRRLRGWGADGGKKDPLLVGK